MTTAQMNTPEASQAEPAVGIRVDRPVRPWERCKEHGPAQPRVWACHACLVELREENQRLRMDLENTRAEAVLAVATERKRWRRAAGYALAVHPDDTDMLRNLPDGQWVILQRQLPAGLN